MIDKSGRGTQTYRAPDISSSPNKATSLRFRASFMPSYQTDFLQEKRVTDDDRCFRRLDLPHMQQRTPTGRVTVET